MAGRGVIAGTFLLFAAMAAAFVFVISSGLWWDSQTVAVGGATVAAVGLAAGVLGRRLFFFMRQIEDGPVLLARHADAVAAAIAVMLLVVFLLPLLEFISRSTAIATLAGVTFVGFIYAGVCLGVAVECAAGRAYRIGGTFLGGLGAGAAAGLAIKSSHLPQLLLACGTCAALASLLYGAGHRRVGQEKRGWKESLISAAVVVVLCIAGVGVLLLVTEPLIARFGTESKGLFATRSHGPNEIVPYLKSLYAHFVMPARIFFLALAGVIIGYATIIAFAKDSKTFTAKHDAVKHILVSILTIAAMGGLLVFSILSSEFSTHYEWIQSHRTSQPPAIDVYESTPVP